MSGKKILVADDEPDIVEILSLRLRKAGFEVSSAKNGEEAVAKAKSEKPLVILMDVMMPVMSGFEAVKKIRQDPATKNIPVIVLSSKGGMKDFFADVPAVEFMQKPFDFEVLMGHIEALVGGVQERAKQLKRIVLAGVEDLLVRKVGSFLGGLHFEVFTALNEANAVLLVRNMRPAAVFCQFWEDEQIFSPCEIARQVSAHASISETPVYVFCKEALSLEAMKSFKPDRIVTFKETSDLLRKVEGLIKK